MPNPVQYLKHPIFRPSGALPNGFLEARDFNKEAQAGEVQVKGQCPFSKLHILNPSPLTCHDTTPLPLPRLLTALNPPPQILIDGHGLAYQRFLRSLVTLCHGCWGEGGWWGARGAQQSTPHSSRQNLTMLQYKCSKSRKRMLARPNTHRRAAERTAEHHQLMVYLVRYPVYSSELPSAAKQREGVAHEYGWMAIVAVLQGLSCNTQMNAESPRKQQHFNIINVNTTQLM